ncbi:MAG: hypothetical protein E5X44_04365 [Mesorhizobium sp.]|nr:MAG: hypothetical protein E5X44_04365 [Mesorhizobium sp.]
MDRASNVSFQAVYRFLKLPDALHLIARCYADSEPKNTFENSLPECKEAMSKFIDAYMSVDFTGLGRLQSFRNSAIAHITMPDIEKAKVTYSDVEKLIRATCEMAGRLTLMLSGGNDWPMEHLEDAHSAVYTFWTKAIKAQ